MSTPSDPPLGIVPLDYSFDTMSLKNGDRLLLLTDGVFEAKNKKGQRIGFENLVSFIKKHAADKENLLDSITDYVHKFSRGVERADDLTIVEVKFSGQMA